MAKQRVFALVAMIVLSLLVAAPACVSKTEYQELQTKLQGTEDKVTQLEKKLQEADGEMTRLKSIAAEIDSQLSITTRELASTTRELASTNIAIKANQQELTSAKSALTANQQELVTTQNALIVALERLKLYQETLGIKVFSGTQPRIAKNKVLGSQVNLINISGARDPTWQQLRTFILTDKTDSKAYVPLFFDCVSFAEELHNNAEAFGIRAAFVAVNFQDTDVGHTLNAFKTLDRGLVYVDSTGEGFKPSKGRSVGFDKIVYVAKDKEFGSISLGENTPLDYDSYKNYYDEMKANWDLYEKKLELYNKEVGKFNSEISRNRYKVRTVEQILLETRQRILFLQQKIELDNFRAQLEPVWDPLGIVKSIEIYW